MTVCPNLKIQRFGHSGSNNWTILKVILIIAFVLSIASYSHAEPNVPTSHQAHEDISSDLVAATHSPQERSDQKSKQNTNDTSSSDHSKTVRVILPPKDNYDYAAFWINCVLALGVVIAFLTLHFIKRQTKTNEETTKVMLEQVKMAINKERARLFVCPPTDDFPVNARSLAQIASTRINVFNVGPTPATNVVGCYFALATESEAPLQQTDMVILDIPEVIAAKQEYMALTVFLNKFENGGGCHATDVFYLHMWGRIDYNDVLSDEQRHTTFRYRIQMTQMRGDGSAHSSSFWQKYGSPQDNEAT
jgi:hypothetical protein